MQGARFYGGKTIISKPNLIYANLTSARRTLVLDTGLSYALAPSKDLASIFLNLDQNYGIQCFADTSKENTLNFHICDLKGKDPSEIPNLQLDIISDRDLNIKNNFDLPNDALF